ncbi:aflatoxin regulatory protein-domain-containing protein [Aspergillus stella-maris]|uniref:aflatoxin regulatory protein-domain-containing protein n=1 Tax=Aspergillus stella-maris TaxID=1810926 RepID=UPI003CCCF708
MSRRLGRTRTVRVEQHATTETMGKAAPGTQTNTSAVTDDHSTASPSSHQAPGIIKHSPRAIAPRSPTIAPELTPQSPQPYCPTDDLNLWDVITSPIVSSFCDLTSFLSVDTEFSHFFASESPPSPDDPESIICGPAVQEPTKVLAEYPSLTELQSPNTSNAHPDNVDTRVTEPCCLFMCLDTLERLFSTARSDCEPLGNRDTLTVDKIETIIKDNERILDTVHSVLECRCADDEYVATLVSLIVFKVLEWYIVVAQIPARGMTTEDAFDWTNEANTSQQSPSSSLFAFKDQPALLLSDYSVNRTHQNRTTAQLVLGELHRVQRLVTIVGRRVDAIQVRLLGMSPAQYQTRRSLKPDSLPSLAHHRRHHHA